MTDSETWAGTIHPDEALRRYREPAGIPAKLAVVGMTPNGLRSPTRTTRACSTSSVSPRQPPPSSPTSRAAHEPWYPLCLRAGTRVFSR